MSAVCEFAPRMIQQKYTCNTVCWLWRKQAKKRGLKREGGGGFVIKIRKKAYFFGEREAGGIIENLWLLYNYSYIKFCLIIVANNCTFFPQTNFICPSPLFWGNISDYIICWILHTFLLVPSYDLLKDKCTDDVIIGNFFPLYYIIKTIRFHVAMHLFSIRSQKMSKIMW